METVTVSTKFQIVIPKSIRSELEIHPGDRIIMFEKDDIIHMVRVQKIGRLRGKFKKLSTKGLRDDVDRF